MEIEKKSQPASAPEAGTPTGGKKDPMGEKMKTQNKTQKKAAAQKVANKVRKILAKSGFNVGLFSVRVNENGTLTVGFPLGEFRTLIDAVFAFRGCEVTVTVSEDPVNEFINHVEITAPVGLWAELDESEFMELIEEARRQLLRAWEE